MATMIVSVPDMISKTGTTRKSWEAKVKRCKRKIPMAIDPEATVMAPKNINRILVISRSRDRPELPLMVFMVFSERSWRNVMHQTRKLQNCVRLRIVLTQRKLVWLQSHTILLLDGFLMSFNASWRRRDKICFHSKQFWLYYLIEKCTFSNKEIGNFVQNWRVKKITSERSERVIFLSLVITLFTVTCSLRSLIVANCGQKLKDHEWAKRMSYFSFTRDCAIYGHSFASLTRCR